MNDLYTITDLQPVDHSYLRYDHVHYDTMNKENEFLANDFGGPDEVMFDYMPNQTFTQEKIALNLDENFKGCPKETFISKLIASTNSDPTKLEEIRLNFFTRVRDKENVAYKTATLKKRYEERRKTGDSLLQKIAKDCYILYVALTDNGSEEILETINVPKSQGTKLSQGAMSQMESEIDKSCDLFFKESLARLDRDFMTMKGATAQYVDSLDKKLKEVIKENERLKSTIKEQDSNINNLKNMIEMSNSKLMELMTEMRT